LVVAALLGEDEGDLSMCACIAERHVPALY
jgi:hypothetical protein